MNNYQNLTSDEIETLRAETYQLVKEASQQSKEATQRFANFEKMLKKQNEKSSRELKEQNEKSSRELKEQSEKLSRELKELYQETSMKFKELGRYLGGVSNSNGEMAEDYFYYTFRKDKTFVNEKFDMIKRNIIYRGVDDDLIAEYDILLFNGTSAAIIEVKYNAKHENISVDNLISRVELFKILYPEYKNHKIYLGVAAMSFKNSLVKELHRAGIATIRPVGKKMVVDDKSVRVF